MVWKVDSYKKLILNQSQIQHKLNQNPSCVCVWEKNDSLMINGKGQI